MNTESTYKSLPPLLLPLLAFAVLWSGSLLAQVPVDDDGNPVEALDAAEVPADSAAAVDEEAPLLTQEELEALVGPIALYPDKLLAIVLPASTYPLEIVQAARFLEQLENDKTLKPDESWDDSVTALLNYPEVVRMMNDDIDWTWRLGEAVVQQQPDVIAAVESFRDRAYAAGNLKTDERQRVSNNDGVIEIQPLEEDIIYVPYYEPERVVHYQPRQVYYYYPRPYPVYYYPYPAYYSFASGYFWGVTTAFHIGWATDHLHVFHHSYWGHPYYGRQYFGHYYRRPSITVYNTYYPNSHRNRTDDHHRNGDYWRPRDGGPRPGHYRARLERYRDYPRERSVEGYRNQRDAGTVGRIATENRAGFRGDAGSTARTNATASREGFAASRNRAAAEQRSRAAGLAGRARQAESAAGGNDPIRFRPRERAATVPQQSRNRSAGDTAVRVPDSSDRSRLSERRNSDDPIRFRSRNRDTGTTDVRSRTSESPGISLRRAGNAESAGRVNRSVVRERPAQAAAPRAPNPTQSSRGFSSSPQRTAPAAQPNISRPQAAPRTSAPRSTPRQSASPAPRPSARAAPSSAPRASRAAAQRRGSGAATSNSRSREN